MLDKIIKTRRSIKKYKAKKPDWRVILDCINSMRYAPMAGNTFSLKFILIDEQPLIEKIAEASEQPFISKSQYIVVACSKGERTKTAFDEERGEKYLRQQAGAAIQNFLLKITESGLSTCWVGHFYDDKIKRLLKIPEDVDIEALFPIGYPAEKPKNKVEVNFDSIMYFNQYGNKKMQKPDKLNT